MKKNIVLLLSMIILLASCADFRNAKTPNSGIGNLVEDMTTFPENKPYRAPPETPDEPRRVTVQQR
jgi:hypothetical protein